MQEVVRNPLTYRTRASSFSETSFNDIWNLAYIMEKSFNKKNFKAVSFKKFYLQLKSNAKINFYLIDSKALRG